MATQTEKELFNEFIKERQEPDEKALFNEFLQEKQQAAPVEAVAPTDVSKGFNDTTDIDLTSTESPTSQEIASFLPDANQFNIPVSQNPLDDPTSFAFPEPSDPADITTQQPFIPHENRPSFISPLPEPEGLRKKVGQLRDFITERTGLFPHVKEPMGGFDRSDRPFTTIGQAGVRTLANVLSGISLGALDVAVKPLGSNNLAELADKLTGFEPTPKEQKIGKTIEFIASIQSAGIIGRSIGVLGQAPKTAGALAKAGEAAKLALIRGTTTEFSKFVADNPEYGGALGVLTDAGIFAAVSLLSSGSSAAWDKLKGSDRTQALKALGLKQGASIDEIKKAAKRKFFLTHPDKVPGMEAEFDKVIRARELLLKPSKSIITRATAPRRRGLQITGEVGPASTPPGSTVQEVPTRALSTEVILPPRGGMDRIAVPNLRAEIQKRAVKGRQALLTSGLRPKDTIALRDDKGRFVARKPDVPLLLQKTTELESRVAELNTLIQKFPDTPIYRQVLEEANKQLGQQQLELKKAGQISNILKGEAPKEGEEIVPLDPEEPPRRTKKQARLIRDIHAQQKLLGMNDATYRQFLNDQTGIATTTRLSNEELTKVFDAMVLQGTDNRVNEIARTIGMTDAERNDVLSRIKGPQAQQIKLTVFEYQKDRPLPNNPDIRRRWINDMKLAAKVQEKFLKKQTKDIDRPKSVVKKVLDTVTSEQIKVILDSFGEGAFDSLRFYMSDLDVQTGKRFWEVYDSITKMTEKSYVDADKSFGDIMEGHGFKRNAYGGLTNTEAIGVADYLYDLDPEIFETLSPRARKTADAISDILHNDPSRPEVGPADTLVKDIIFRRWKIQQIQLEKQIELELEKESPSKSKITKIREKQEKILPKAFDGQGKALSPEDKLDMLATIDDALNDGTYWTEITKHRFGTRRVYYMSDPDFEAWTGEVLNIVTEPEFAFNIETKVEAKLDDAALNTRNGKGTALHKNPLLAVKQHLTRLSRISAIMEPMLEFTEMAQNANLTERQRVVLKRFMENAAGKHQDVGKVIDAFNMVRHQWWRKRGWIPTELSKFAVRNIFQNSLLLAQIDATRAIPWAINAYRVIGIGKVAGTTAGIAATIIPGAGPKAIELGGELGARADVAIRGEEPSSLNPWLVEDIVNYGDFEIASKRQIFNLMSLSEYSLVGNGNANWQALMDWGANGMGASDVANRMIYTYPVMHQAAYETVTKMTSGQIPMKTLYNRLKLDILPAAQRQFLETFLDNDQFREFVRHYANIKTLNVHYGYGVLEKAAVEQDRAVRSFFGVMTWPRSAVENYVRSGIKPFFEGASEWAKTGDSASARKSFEGFKVFIKYSLVMAGMAKATEKMGSKMYGVLMSTLYAPGSPELTTVAASIDTITTFFNQLRSGDIEQQTKAVKSLLFKGLDIVGIVFLPIAAAAMEEWTILAEVLDDKAETKHRDTIQRIWKDVVEIEYGPNSKDVERNAWQKFMRIWVKSEETEQSKFEKEKEREADKIKQLQSIL